MIDESWLEEEVETIMLRRSAIGSSSPLKKSPPAPGL
jgi:hypothetical protein